MITLGGLTIAATDCPEKLPLGGSLDFTKDKLSDGSNLVSATGWTPVDLSLTGTLRNKGGNLAPMDLSDKIEAMARRGQPVPFVWTSDSGRVKSFYVTITSWLPVIVEDDRVDYTLALTREQDGGLRASLGIGVASGSDKRTQSTSHLKNLNRLRSGATAGTQAKIDAVSAAAGRLPAR